MFPLTDRLVTIERRTTLVLDAVAIAASLDPDRQPVRASVIKVKVSGASASGTVTISGTREDGSSGTDALAYDGDGSRSTARAYTALDASGGFTTTGLTGATIEAQAVGKGGEPQAQSTTLVSDYPAGIKHSGTPGWPAEVPGSARMDTATFTVPWCSAFTPRVGDHLIDQDGTRWLVQGVRTVPSPMQPQEWLLRCTRYSDS